MVGGRDGGMHLRFSGEWDPAGSSAASLFGMRRDGVVRSQLLLNSLNPADNRVTRLVFLATDSTPLKQHLSGVTGGHSWDEARDRLPQAGESQPEPRDWGVWPDRWRVLTTPFQVGHSAGAAACGDVRGCRESAANFTAAQHVQIIAEWWLLAAAQEGWVLTRGSSFGLTAAARGLHLGHRALAACGKGSATHGRLMQAVTAVAYTVHEHKVQRGLDCQTFDFCALHPPHASPQR